MIRQEFKMVQLGNIYTKDRNGRLETKCNLCDIGHTHHVSVIDNIDKSSLQEGIWGTAVVELDWKRVKILQFGREDDGYGLVPVTLLGFSPMKDVKF